MAEIEGYRDLTDEQCIELATQIFSLCSRLHRGNRMDFDSAGYALIAALRDQAFNLMSVLEIIHDEKWRNINDREN